MSIDVSPSPHQASDESDCSESSCSEPLSLQENDLPLNSSTDKETDYMEYLSSSDESDYSSNSNVDQELNIDSSMFKPLYENAGITACS